MEEPFVVDTDVKAEWALNKIRERAAERDRLMETSWQMIETYKAVIKEEADKAAAEISVFEGMLLRYFETVDHKATKTQETYKLPTGKLKMKLSAERMVPNEELLITAYPDFVKRTPTLQWGELKKRLQIAEDKVIDTDTGEIVQGVTLEKVPPKFIVEA